MEDIRELIIVGGGVLIAAIVVHGLWLAWRSRNALRMRIEPNLVPEEEEEDWLSADFPSGGARLLESDEAPPQPAEDDPWGLADTPAAAEEPAPEAAESAAWQDEAAQRQEADPLLAPEPILNTGTKRGEPQGTAAPDTAPPPADAEPAQQSEQGAPPNDPLLLVHVLAPQGERFDGEALLRALRAEHLKYGRLQIFHRADPQTQKHWFSVANAVEPGYFDLGKDCASRGVTAFMQLSGDEDDAAALDDMLRTAEALAQSLGGTVLDSQRRPFTSQTLAEYRNRLADFAQGKMVA